MRVVVEIDLKPDQLGRHQVLMERVEKLVGGEGHRVTNITFHPDHPAEDAPGPAPHSEPSS